MGDSLSYLDNLLSIRMSHGLCRPLYFPLHFSINLLAFYHEYRSLIGYATHYLFCDR